MQINSISHPGFGAGSLSLASLFKTKNKKKSKHTQSERGYPWTQKEVELLVDLRNKYHKEGIQASQLWKTIAKSFNGPSEGACKMRFRRLINKQFIVLVSGGKYAFTENYLQGDALKKFSSDFFSRKKVPIEVEKPIFVVQKGVKRVFQDWDEGHTKRLIAFININAHITLIAHCLKRDEQDCLSKIIEITNTFKKNDKGDYIFTEENEILQPKNKKQKVEHVDMPELDALSVSSGSDSDLEDLIILADEASKKAS